MCLSWKMFMRPIEIIFEAPELMMSRRVHDVRRKISENPNLQNRDIVLKIIDELQSTIGQLRARHARDTELERLNTCTRDFIPEANNLTTYCEALFNQVDSTDKLPAEILVEMWKNANPNSEVSSKQISGVVQDLATRANTAGCAAFTILKDFFGISESKIGSDAESEISSDAEDDGVAEQHPGLLRVNAIRAAIKNSRDELYRMQDDRQLPHDFFGLDKAFDAMQCDIERSMTLLFQYYDDVHQWSRIISYMMAGHPVSELVSEFSIHSPSSSSSSSSSSARSNSSFFMNPSSPPAPRHPSSPPSPQPPRSKSPT